MSSPSGTTTPIASSEITPLIHNYGIGGIRSSFTSSSSSSSFSSTNNTFNPQHQQPTGIKMTSSNPATTNNAGSGGGDGGGELKVTVLAAYDLLVREPPSYVSVQVNHRIGQTGPPIQRHKDRNSFKFGAGGSSNNSVTSLTTTTSTAARNSSTSGGTSSTKILPISRNEVIVHGPLPELYNSTVKIQMVYTAHKEYTLSTEYPLNQLSINEPMWLILRLDKVNGIKQQTTTSSSSTTSTNQPSYEEGRPSPSSVGAATGDDDTEDIHQLVPPTIRVQMTLRGPYRPEIGAMVQVSHTWFQFVDSMEHHIHEVFSCIPTVNRLGGIPGSTIISKFDMKYLLLPAVPLLSLLVVASPIVIGVGVATLPILLPILSILLIILGIVTTVGGILFISSSTGRDSIGSVLLKPIGTTFLASKAGQRLVYETGPRPSPVALVRAITPGPEQMIQRLIVSLVIDLIGSMSYLIPILGEVTDVVWAPIQTIFILALYGTTSPNLQYVSFLEEILPFTDIVPTATLGWFLQYGIPFIVQHVSPSPSNSKSNTGVGTSQQQQQQLTLSQLKLS